MSLELFAGCARIVLTRYQDAVELHFHVGEPVSEDNLSTVVRAVPTDCEIGMGHRPFADDIRTLRVGSAVIALGSDEVVALVMREMGWLQ